SDSSSSQTTEIPGFHCTIQHHIRHVSGSKNVVADTLSRINEVHLPKIDFSAMAEAQASDEELQAILGKNELSFFFKTSLNRPRFIETLLRRQAKQNQTLHSRNFPKESFSSLTQYFTSRCACH
ncbi:transposon Ty3-I Gag-Pol polyprotein, partial [Trichonephila clavata]